MADTGGIVPYISLLVGWRFRERFLTLFKMRVKVPSNRFSSFLDKVQVSEPYNSIGSMAALKISSLNALLRFDDQILCIALHAAQAIPFLVRKSFSEEEI